MTRWLIAITSETPQDDSKVLDILKRIGNTGLRYTVNSKEAEAPPEGTKHGREGGTA